MNPANVLLLPGWHNSGPAHWQSNWERTHGYVRVQQHDWAHPLRGDWLMQLEAAVLDAVGEVILVAHSLGCIQVAAWTAHSRHTSRIKAALLVAPADVECDALHAQLPSWSPIARQTLPFKSVLVASRNDPFCTWAQSQALAIAWGSALVDGGSIGHINAEAGLADWPQGHELLRTLCEPLDSRLCGKTKFQ
jgi:predicted alpha/beta hydrolase family esterase